VLALSTDSEVFKCVTWVINMIQGLLVLRKDVVVLVNADDWLRFFLPRARECFLSVLNAWALLS